MRNEKLGTDTTALRFDFDAATQSADVIVSVAGTDVLGALRIHANGTVSNVSVTTTERNALANLAAGQTVYNETTNKLNFYNGTAWQAVTSA